jgi:hypothetical protein
VAPALVAQHRGCLPQPPPVELHQHRGGVAVVVGLVGSVVVVADVGVVSSSPVAAAATAYCSSAGLPTTSPAFRATSAY